MSKHTNLRIAITGANGFVAKNVRNYLNNKGIELIGIARKNFQNYKSETKIISSEFKEQNLLSKLKTCNALIHLIGSGRQSSDADYESVNVEITTKIVELCKKAKIKKIVYISGLGVSKDSTLGYFISKFKAEQQIIKSGLDYTILRSSYIIGNGDPLTKNLNLQIKKGLIIIPGSGKYQIQPIFVNDVANVIWKAVISKKFSNKILDLVGPEKVSFNEFVKVFKNKSKTKIQNIDLEKVYYKALHNSDSEYGPDDLSILVGDFAGNYKKLKNLAGFEFRKYRKVLHSSSLS